MKNCANLSKAPYNGDVVALSFDNDVVDDEGPLFSPFVVPFVVPLVVPLVPSEASLSPVAATSKK